jgi:hypothetical protein
MIYIISIPSVVLWVLGIPSLWYWLLRRNTKSLDLTFKREKLSDDEIGKIHRMQWKYGFMLSGYEQKSFCWEIVIMFRKAALVGSATLLSVISIKT